MKLILMLLRASWIESSVAILMSALNALATVGLIALIHQVLQDSSLTNGLDAALFATLCAIVIVTNVGSQVLLTRVSQRSVSDLLHSLCLRILAIPLRQLETIGTFRAMSALTTDVSMIAMAVQGIPVLCGNLLALVFGLIYLGSLSLKVLFGAVAFIVVGFLTYQMTAGFAKKYLTRGRDAQDILMLHLRNLVDGMKELKMHRQRRDAFANDMLTSTNAEVRRNQTIGYSIQAAAISWGRLTFFIAIGVLIFVMPRSEGMTAANLTGCVLTILYLMTPLERIIAWIPLMSRANISLQKIRDLGAAITPEADEPSLRIASQFTTLQFSSVEFNYDRHSTERAFAFGPVDFELSPGEVIFVVGGNGSGKTTFLKLLTGLYVAGAGEIKLDGKRVLDENLEAYRQLFSVVFAEPVLFDSLLGLDHSRCEDHLVSLLKHLELDRFVKVDQGKLSTIDLSKGQRKRLALLTAYLEDRPIYVFDEWAADQDPVYKRVFYEEILPALQSSGKAVVVISHDDQYFHHADRVVRLDAGRIVDQHASVPALFEVNENL